MCFVCCDGRWYAVEALRVISHFISICHNYHVIFASSIIYMRPCTTDSARLYLVCAHYCDGITGIYYIVPWPNCRADILCLLLVEGDRVSESGSRYQRCRLCWQVDCPARQSSSEKLPSPAVLYRLTAHCPARRSRSE